MDKENNGMHVNPIINDAQKKKKKRLVKNFPVSIDRASIEHQSKLAEASLQKWKIFD